MQIVINTVQAIPKWRLFQNGGIPIRLKFQNGVQIKYGGHYEMSTHSREYYHYRTAIPGKYQQHQLIQINEHTTRIRVLRHSRFSNPANQEALTLLYKENISHGVQKNDSNTNTDKTLPNDRNYFRYRETTMYAQITYFCANPQTVPQVTDVWPVRPVTCQWARQKTRE